MRKFFAQAESLESRRLLSDASALDPSFGAAGVAAMPVGSGEAKAMAPLSDGRIVAVSELDGTGIALAIIKSDGTIESSRERDYGVSVKIEDMVLDPAGKIVVAGTIQDEDSDPNTPENLPPQFLVLRFNNDLSPDKTFGTNGAARTDWSDVGFAAQGRSLAVSSTGKITLAGLIQLDINSTVDTRIAVAQYNSDGSPNNAFNVDGRTVTDTPSNQQLGAVDVGQIIYQPDGKAILVGTTRGDMLLVRYNLNGTLDHSFSTDGLASADIAHGTSDFGNALAIQSDGKIVIAGGSQGASQTDSALVRFNTNGSIDTTFGAGGIVVASTGLSQDEHINRLALRADDSIVAGGIAGTNIMVTQFATNGALDTSFGESGFASISQAGGAPGATGVLLQSDGKILVSGEVSSVGVLTIPAPAVMRLGREDFALTNNGELIFSGTSGADVIRVSRVSGNVRVTFNGVVTTLTSPTHTITAQLGAGNDVFVSSLGLPTTVNGATGNDSIVTGDAADSITGAAGNDTISSGGGNDTVSGTGGRDVIFGGIGDDFLIGGSEADAVSGDDGNDTIWDYGFDNDSGGEGNDTFSFAAGNVTASGGNGDDVIVATGEENSLDGGGGNDRIDGGEGHEFLAGGEGNDTLFGHGGTDQLNGNAGADVLAGGTGADFLSGGGGKDRLGGEGGRDRIYGGDANDIIDGGTDNDFVSGGNGNDNLTGGQGDDTLDGGNGIDVFVANLGNDKIFSRDNNAETLDGGTGEDTGIIDSIDSLISVESDDLLFQ